MNKLIILLFILSILPCALSVDPNDALGQNCTNDSKRRVCGDRLICLNGTCSNCEFDSQCSSTGNIVCKSASDILESNTITNSQITRVCDHKDIFSSVNGYDVGAILLVLFVGAFSAVAGIGGGGFYVVILFLMLEFPIEVAARLSTATIFGISIVNMLNYMPMRHPKQDKPLIDYNTTVMMETYTLAGTVFGVILNIIFPGWLISILLVLILVFVGVKVIRRYAKLTKKDNDDESDNERDVEMDPVSPPQFVPNPIPNKDPTRKYMVLPKNTILIVCWIILVIFSLLKGGKSGDSIVGVQQCSGLFWGLNVLQVVAVSTVGVIFSIYLYKKHRKNKERGKEYKEGDVAWNKKNSFVLPPILLLGGLVAATFGLGGGIIKTPVMLQLEMLPDVLIATSGYSLIFTSSISLVQYFIFGVLPLDYAVIFIATGFLSALLGHLIIGIWVSKKGKPTILLLILGVLTFLIAAVALDLVFIDL